MAVQTVAIVALLLGDAVLGAGLWMLLKARKAERSYLEEIAKKDGRIKFLEGELEERIERERKEWDSWNDPERKANVIRIAKERLGA